MKKTRNFSPLDNFLTRIDQALKTSNSEGPQSARQPAQLKGRRAHSHTDSKSAADENSCDENKLDEKSRAHTAGLMRINHTGEVCAQALYQGQALTAKLPHVREKMEQAANEEIDHLAWCGQRLTELESQPSQLNPLFYGASFTIGALAGIAGDKWSLGFVAETEKQVCEHLQKHLQQLHPEDDRSREILSQMYIDEARHADMADEAGAAALPALVKKAMQQVSKIMTFSTYRF